ncbi:hypothetical protein [Kribbella sp. NPDC048915]
MPTRRTVTPRHHAAPSRRATTPHRHRVPNTADHITADQITAG